MYSDKPESLCMHFSSDVYYNVDARMLLLLSNTTNVEIDNISGSSKSQQTSNFTEYIKYIQVISLNILDIFK